MAAPRLNPLLMLPPLVFVLFGVVAYVGLKRENPGELPSALTGQPAPSLGRIVPLGDAPAPTDADLRAPGVKLVNFWASWCGPCRAEHPLLTRIAASGLPVIGIDYKDAPEDALAFLDELGNPFAKLGADVTGRTGIDWGIYGVPETFVIGPDGTVLLRHPGPMTPEIFEARVKPAIDAAR